MAKIKRVEHVSTFEAASDTGQRYRIQLFQEIHDVATVNDPGGEAPGLQQLRTIDRRRQGQVRDRRAPEHPRHEH